MKMKKLLKVIPLAAFLVFSAKASIAAQFLPGGNALDDLMKGVGKNGIVLMGEVTKVDRSNFPALKVTMKGEVLKAFASYTAGQNVEFTFQVMGFKMAGLSIPKEGYKGIIFLYGISKAGNTSIITGGELPTVQASDGNTYVTGLDASKPEAIIKDVTALKANVKALGSGGTASTLDQALNRVLAPPQKIKVKAFTATTVPSKEASPAEQTVDSNLKADDVATILKAMSLMY